MRTAFRQESSEGIKPTAAPAVTSERIEVLDGLRGFALFGILLVNIIDWSGWGSASLPESQKVALAGPQWAFWFDFLRTMLIEGKFYTIFSFLFGLGFALQLARLERRGANGTAIYRRRLLVLLAIGITHLLFVWDGDILTLYAALGLTLPFFRRWPDARLLWTAVALLLLPIIGYSLVAALDISPTLGLNDLGDRIFIALGGELSEDIGIAWRQREDLVSYLAYALSGWPFRLGGFVESWRIPKVLAMMLIGLWAGRRLIAGRLLADRALLKRVALAGFLVGIPANIGYAAIGGLSQDSFTAGLKATVLYAIGVVPLGLAYAATFALLWRSGSILGVFVAPGRMALTNYLTHSVLGVVIFYGIGFGLIAAVPPWTIYGIALGIFISQVILSRLWLAHFQQGPMEWLWRLGTYGRHKADAT